MQWIDQIAGANSIGDVTTEDVKYTTTFNHINEEIVDQGPVRHVKEGGELNQ